MITKFSTKYSKGWLKEKLTNLKNIFFPHNFIICGRNIFLRCHDMLKIIIIIVLCLSSKHHKTTGNEYNNTKSIHVMQFDMINILMYDIRLFTLIINKCKLWTQEFISSAWIKPAVFLGESA